MIAFLKRNWEVMFLSTIVSTQAAAFILVPAKGFLVFLNVACIYVSILALTICSYHHGRRAAYLDTLENMNSYRAWMKVWVKEKTGMDLEDEES